MTPLQSLLDTFRKASQSEREKGNYFEELIRTYFRYEARFEELYSDVWLYSDWAKENELDAKDTGAVKIEDRLAVEVLLSQRAVESKVHQVMLVVAPFE